MRLRAIKLNGFKSFVDPTTVSLPSNLCAVVGPNGCGKSNIIDAVRWVMGESSAKNLRGETMTDVIFNGSTSRKPIGQASIELVFDNSEGRITGEFASYNELSIQRKVTRDGLSSYSVNGQKCRRKDITDLFLGTGIGPRSYSIIEQGMISDLVEARPEELRVFIEEAAGISKYKERRKETERRIARTRDNLERLTDIREELERQIHHLQRQARAAERYKTLKSDERLARAQLQSIHWGDLNQQVEARERDIARVQLQQDAATADLRALDLKIENDRERHQELADNGEQIQKRYYDLGTEIARIEESIQYQQDRAGQLEADLQQVIQSTEQVEADLEADRGQLQGLTAELAGLAPDLAQAEQDASSAGARLANAEREMTQWQEAWDTFNQQASEARQRAEVEQSRILHLEQSVARLNDRLSLLQEESEKLAARNLEEQMAPLEEQLGLRAEMVRAVQANVDELVGAITQQREENHRLSQQLDQARAAAHNLTGRKASLDALQQAALGQHNNDGVEWLERHALAEAKRVAEVVQVAPGWEFAVETVLGDHLQAVCVDDIEFVATLLGDFNKGSLKGSLAFLEAGAVPGGERGTGDDMLLGKVTSSVEVSPWLAGIHTSESLTAALQKRATLQPGESVITREGIWIGPTWLRLAGEMDPGIGILKRQQEVALLEQQIAAGEQDVSRLLAGVESGNQRLRDLERQREELQLSLAEEQKVLSNAQAEFSGWRVELDRVRTDRDRTAHETHQNRHQLEQDQTDLKSARQIWQAALEEMSQHAEEREALQASREQVRANLAETREAADRNRERHHGLALRQQSITVQVNSTNQAVERLTSQLALLINRKEVIARSIAESSKPRGDLKEELERQMSSRLAVEKELAEVRQQLEQVERSSRELGRDRSVVEERIQAARDELGEIKLARQTLDVRRATIAEQLTAEGFHLPQLVAEMPEGLDETALEATLTRIGNSLQRLGAINLAAIEEFELQTERKKYLDAQNADLEDALDTLQRAIRKIDRETRTRFKETFDIVNGKLQTIFPKLFGGGHAYLEMTGEDLLDTGVTMLARPPGKRNTTVHSLSGGEKALTAIAMVFAIFSLNPAPFCMLDEVDAPLDDANTLRYCDLVKEMSRQVQFVFITHNKIAMEMAHHMMGVTMDEPGVSRMVSVDMEEAVAMATV